MPEDKDIREEILDFAAQEAGYKNAIDMICINGSIDPVYNAMDERARRMCMDLLQWMAENEIEIDISSSVAQNTSEKIFYYKGQYLTKEELFSNFL